MSRFTYRRSWQASALLMLLSLSGCAQFRDSEPSLRNDVIKPADKGRGVNLSSAGFGGVTSESQQIERNLGIR